MRTMLLLMLGVAFAFGAAQAATTSNCQRYRLASLPMSYDRAMRPLIPAKINGVDVPFLVDTGGIDSELSAETVEKMNLSKTLLEWEARVYNVKGEAKKYKTKADTFSMGAMSATSWPFLVSAQNDIAIGGSEVGGLLAPDIMVKYDVEFDFGANKFNIFSYDDCPGRVVYWTQQPYVAIPFHMNADSAYHIYATAKLDGETVDVMIDSGASISNVTDANLSRVLPAKQDPARIKTLDNMGDGFIYRFHSLDLNGLKVQDPEILVIPEKLGAINNMDRANPVVVLGDTVLRNLHTYIAYREKVLYITPADAR